MKIAAIQKTSVPHFPSGKKVRVKMNPKHKMNIKIGDKKPHIGQIARVKKRGNKTELIVMIGTSFGTFSMSASSPFKGMMSVTYNMIVMFKPRHTKVKFIKSELINSFSHSYLKKLVL